MLDNPPRRDGSGEGVDDPTVFPGSQPGRMISSSLDRVERRPSTMIDLPPSGRPSVSLHLEADDSHYNHNITRPTDLDSPVSPLSPVDSHYPHPPSNEAIEQIIANAMALAGSGPSSNSGSSSTPAPSGQHPHQHPFQQGGHAVGPPALPRSDGSFGSNNGGTRGDVHTGGDVSGRPGTGVRTGSDGYLGGTGTGYSGQLPPLGGAGNGVGNGAGSGGRLGGTIGTFQGRSHTPIMFHPAAVGVDGRVNLFVGNLPYRVRWQDVKDLFRRAGTVLRADVALDPQSNRSRGHGSVLMGSQEDGIKAIEMFNGYNWQTRVLEVRPDRLPPEYEPHPYIPPSSYAMPGRGAGGGGQMPSNMGGGLGMNMGGNMSGINMGLGQGMGMNMNMNMGGAGGPFSQGMMNWNTNQQQMTGSMNSPIRSVSQPRPAGSQLRHSGIVDPQGGYMNDPRLPISPPVADRRTPIPGQGRAISPFGERERRSSFFNTGEDVLKRTDSRATIGPSGHSPNVTQRIPLGLQSAQSSYQDPRGLSSSQTQALRQAPRDDGPQLGNEYYEEHRKASTQPSTIGESQYVFDSRRGSLVGIGPGLATRERGSGDSLFGNESVNGSAQRPAYNRQDTVGGRLLYVANLPFNASWQELKDLFRTVGGNVVRADIALGPDGRSKGFGNVLFQNEEDAAVAVQAFDGYEFNGRAIKVRQDRNSTGAGISTQSVSSSNQIRYGPGTMGPDGFQSRNDRQPGAALRQAIHLRTDRVLDEQADSLSNIGNGLGSSPKRVAQEDPRNPVTAGIRRGQIGSNVTPSSGAPSGRFRNASHPGRIIMPSFNGFGQVNPLSPVQPRGMPPMTPSMPGYNFHAYPSTPPLHPISFLSPGLGPFSPTLNSPTAFGFNPFHAAPGAPLMTPGVPHPMSNMGNGYGPPGAHNIAHTPGHGHFGQQNFPSTPGAPIGGRGQEPDYFPTVPTGTERKNTGPEPSRGTFTGLESEDHPAGLGLASISASDMQRLQNVAGASPSETTTGAIREQIESLVLSTDSAPPADKLGTVIDGPASMIGTTSRASFDFGLTSRQALSAMFDKKGLGVEQTEHEKERRASMDDGKRS